MLQDASNIWDVHIPTVHCTNMYDTCQRCKGKNYYHCLPCRFNYGWLVYPFCCIPGGITINNYVNTGGGQGHQASGGQSQQPSGGQGQQPSGGQGQQPSGEQSPQSSSEEGQITTEVINKVLDENSDHILFDIDKWNLKLSSYESLDKILQIMNQYPNTRYYIDGHTDNTFTEAHNMELSWRRAKAVADYFISRGISPSRLIIRWYGESKPRASNSTPEGRTQNRRVEIHLIEPGESHYDPLKPDDSQGIAYYTIQLGAYHNKKDINEGLFELQEVFIYIGPDGLLHLCYGKYRTRKEAEDAIDFIITLGIKDAWIRKIEPTEEKSLNVY